MKKFFLITALAVGSAFAPAPKAEAGVVLLTIPFFHRDFQRPLMTYCHRGSGNGWFADWFPCLGLLILGEEGEAKEDATAYLSDDHILVKKGAVVSNGEFVKYTKSVQTAHNRQRDDYVDFLEDYLDELESIDPKERGTLAEGLSKAAKLVDEILDRDYAEVFKTDAEKIALKNFLKRQFSLSFETTKVEKED